MNVLQTHIDTLSAAQDVARLQAHMALHQALHSADTAAHAAAHALARVLQDDAHATESRWRAAMLLAHAPRPASPAVQAALLAAALPPPSALQSVNEALTVIREGAVWALACRAEAWCLPSLHAIFSADVVEEQLRYFAARGLATGGQTALLRAALANPHDAMRRAAWAALAAEAVAPTASVIHGDSDHE
jgi:hypothetical protein